MIVDEYYRDNVGYIVAEVWDRDRNDWNRQPVGTVFFVAVTLKGMGMGSVWYAVTCKHVILGTAGQSLFIRINKHDGTASDIPHAAQHWVLHPDTDVAVTPVSIGPGFKVWKGVDVSSLASR